MTTAPIIMFSSPLYDGRPNHEHSLSITRDMMQLVQSGIGIIQRDLAGSSRLALARSLIVARFMAEPQRPTHLLMSDADISWPSGTVMRLLSTMLKDDVDILAVAGCKRHGDEELAVAAWDISGTLYLDKTVGLEGLVRVAAVGTGMLMLSRSAIERLEAKHPKLRFRINNPVLDDEQDHAYAWFHEILEDRNVFADWWGEDFSFCKRCCDANESIWVDPWVELSHTSEQRYGGRLIDQLALPGVRLDLPRDDDITLPDASPDVSGLADRNVAAASALETRRELCRKQ